MSGYVVTLEIGTDQHIIERWSSSETIRDLITDVGLEYRVDVVRFELNIDGKSFDGQNAPLDKVFLDKTVEEVLGQDEDSAEENTIVLTVKKYDEEKKQKIAALKNQVRDTKAAWEAAVQALKTAAAPNFKGGNRK